MYGLPRSLWWFAATAIIFVLQWIPVTGIFLMFLLAPYWSILTVNAGFVSLGVEAALGRTSPYWLLAPLVWFGGYAIAAHQSDQELQRLDAEVRAGNARHIVPFDAAGAVIAVTYNADDLGNAGGQLVQKYRLPVAYTDHSRYRQARRANELPRTEAGHHAERVGPAEICSRIQKDPRARPAGINAHYLQQKKPAAGAQACAYHMLEDPLQPVYRISAASEKLGSMLLSGRVKRLTVTAPDGTSIELRSGQAAALSSWPMPVMGCFLNSGRPAWECQAGFVRKRAQGLGGTGAYGAAAVEVVARAFGLEERQASDSLDEEAASGIAALERALDRHETAASSNLDRLLADPTLRATVHDLAGLVERPELLVPRADAMVAAMSAALAHSKGNSESARNLQRLIAALPEPEFERLGADILRRLDEGRPAPEQQGRRPVRERIDESLAIRLGDLGAPALSLLERLAFAPRGDTAPHAVLGLCRMGRPASGLAPRLVEHIQSSAKPSADLRAAAYVTLVRWGRSDFAEPLMDGSGSSARRDYARRWPGLTPESGPEMCTLRYRA